MMHADMSPDQFADSMHKRGESVMTMGMRMLGYAMTRPDEPSGGASNGQLLLAFSIRTAPWPCGGFLPNNLPIAKVPLRTWRAAADRR